MNAEAIDRYLIDPEFAARARTELLGQGEEPWSARLAQLAGETFDRQTLAGELHAYNLSLDNDAAALANSKRLAEPEAVAIVTGQQAGLFTGPLYTIHKAITALRLAAACEEQLGVPVVPIFWNATEDHDLSEIATAQFPEQSWTASFPKAGMAAEALSTRPAVTSVVSAYLETLTPMRHREEIEALLAPTFVNYGIWTSAVLARLFRGTGLVIMEPRLLRPHATSFFRQVVGQREAIREALRTGAAALAPFDLEPSFTADNSFGLFQIDEDGHRRRLVERQGKLLFGHEWVAPEVVEETMEADPGAFSTAAYLRPVLQNRQIPTLAYVGGPGEFRYHLQLPPLYELLGTSMPVLHLRNHATILGPKEEKLARKLDLQPADFFREPTDYYHSVDLPEHVAETFERTEAQLHELFAGLEAVIDIDQDPRRFRGYETRFRKDLGNLRHKIRRDYQRRAGVDNGRVDRFFAAVRPKHGPQDRLLNVFYLIESYGPDLIGHLIELFDPFDPRHLLIRE